MSYRTSVRGCGQRVGAQLFQQRSAHRAERTENRKDSVAGGEGRKEQQEMKREVGVIS